MDAMVSRIDSLEWPVSVDRREFSVVPRSQSGHDLAYWLTRSAAERLVAIEVQRLIVYGRSRAAARLQRVLRLLNAHRVSYLIVGGYAVGFHGHPRATADIDIWVPRRADTAQQLVAVLRAFGFDVPQLSTDLFLRPDQVIRLGVPPLRIELLTTLSGVEFEACYGRGVPATLGDVDVRIIALDDLKTNKRAAGRHQDLADLEHLP